MHRIVLDTLSVACLRACVGRRNSEERGKEFGPRRGEPRRIDVADGRTQGERDWRMQSNEEERESWCCGFVSVSSSCEERKLFGALCSSCCRGRGQWPEWI